MIVPTWEWFGAQSIKQKFWGSPRDCIRGMRFSFTIFSLLIRRSCFWSREQERLRTEGRFVAITVSCLRKRYKKVPIVRLAIEATSAVFCVKNCHLRRSLSSSYRQCRRHRRIMSFRLILFKERGQREDHLQWVAPPAATDFPRSKDKSEKERFPWNPPTFCMSSSLRPRTTCISVFTIPCSFACFTRIRKVIRVNAILLPRKSIFPLCGVPEISWGPRLLDPWGNV